MAAQVEVPDGYRVVTLVGVESDGTPQVVQLDGTGRIVAVIQGEIEGITGPVDVTQTDSVREIQGSDGSTLRTVKLDANGQIIMVPRGQSGNYMSVDASGFLTSVMKGEYSGTPTTLAVDSSGNIVAVVKGDYGGVPKTLTTDADGRLQIVPYDPDDIWGNAIALGNAELAAVISPAHRYDRRGNLVLLDDFSGGLQGWIAAYTGTGGAAVVSTVAARSAPYSIKLTTGQNAAGNANISKYWPKPSTGRLGLEVSFAAVSTDPEVRLRFYHYDGANYHLFSIKYDFTDQDLQYLDNAAAWHTVASSLAFYPNYTSFNTMKLVVNLANNTYERAMMNSGEYDLAGIDALTVVSATAPYLAFVVFADGDNSANYTVYIDDVILTQNEPE